MTFSEGAATIEKEASTDIIEMIEELSHHTSSAIPMIGTGETFTSAEDVPERSSLPEDFQEELLSSTPQLGEIEELQFVILIFEIVTNIIVVATRNIAPAQTSKLVLSTSAGDSSLVLWWMKLSWQSPLLKLP